MPREMESDRPESAPEVLFELDQEDLDKIAGGEGAGMDPLGGRGS